MSEHIPTDPNPSLRCALGFHKFRLQPDPQWGHAYLCERCRKRHVYEEYSI